MTGFERAPSGQVLGGKTVTFQDAGAAVAKTKPLAPKSFALTRKWLAVNPQGELQHLELAKLRVTHSLGVQLRDLRCASALLGCYPPSTDGCCCLRVLLHAGNRAATGPGSETSHWFGNGLAKGRKARQRRATRPPPQSTETVPRRLAASLRAS